MKILGILLICASLLLLLTALFALFKPSAFSRLATQFYKKPVGRTKTALIPFSWACIAFALGIGIGPTAAKQSKQSQASTIPETTPSKPEVAVASSPSVKTIPIKPEDVVSFPKSTYLCLNQDLLLEALAHGVKGEKTKLEAMFKKDAVLGAPKCAMAKPDLKFKVLAVDHTQAWDFLEVVPNGSPESEGIWAIDAETLVVK